MAKKKIRHKVVPPSSHWIKHDRRQKERLEKEFFVNFLPLLKRAIEGRVAPSDLEIPLKRLQKSINFAMYGIFFGPPLKRRR